MSLSLSHLRQISKIIPINFAPNSTRGQWTTPMSVITLFFSLSLSVWKVSKLKKSLSLWRLLLRKKYVVIRKRLISELSSIFTNLFNRCLKDNLFLVNARLHPYAHFPGIRVSNHLLHNIAALASSVPSINFLRLSSTRKLSIKNTITVTRAANYVFR